MRKNYKIHFLFTLLFLAVSFMVKAQDADSILNILTANKAPEKVTATFKSTHLVLLNTNETQKKKDLAFWVAHRFGDIGGEFGGSHTLFGLDVAPDIYIGFDYGISDRFTVGFGRSKMDETYNFLGKYKLLEQQQNLPISLTLFAQSAWITRKAYNDSEFLTESNRISHYFSTIFTSKLSSNLSLLMSPGILLRDKVAVAGDQKALFSVGFGGRLKLYKRFSLIADYTLIEGLGRPQNLTTKYYNPLGAGIEIETGGHVFSLNLQNAPYIIENNFIADTQKSWRNGGVRFGFAISRNFSLFQKKRIKNSN